MSNYYWINKWNDKVKLAAVCIYYLSGRQWEELDDQEKDDWHQSEAILLGTLRRRLEKKTKTTKRCIINQRLRRVCLV